MDTHSPEELLNFFAEEILQNFEAFILEDKVCHLEDLEHLTTGGLTQEERRRQRQFDHDKLMMQQHSLCRDEIASFILLFLLMQEPTKVSKINIHNNDYPYNMCYINNFYNSLN